MALCLKVLGNGQELGGVTLSQQDGITNNLSRTFGTGRAFRLFSGVSYVKSPMKRPLWTGKKPGLAVVKTQPLAAPPGMSGILMPEYVFALNHPEEGRQGTPLLQRC
jgi:hypothetical protein